MGIHHLPATEKGKYSRYQRWRFSAATSSEDGLFDSSLSEAPFEAWRSSIYCQLPSTPRSGFVVQER